MAAFTYDAGTFAVNTGAIVPGTTPLKIMLVGPGYTASKKDAFAAAAAHELNATGYAGGFGGAGRLSAGTITVVNDAANDLTKWVFTDRAWGNLGGAVNDVIKGAVLFKPGTADDSTAIPMAWWPLPDTPVIQTNTSPFTLTADAVNGNVVFANV